MNRSKLKTEIDAFLKSDAHFLEYFQHYCLDGMWYWNLEERNQEWVNAGFWKALGYEINEISERALRWQDHIVLEDKERSLKDINQHCLDSNQPYSRIVRYRHKDGHIIWMKSRGFAIRNDKGRAIRMIGTCINITEQKKNEEELLNQNQALSDISKKDYLTGIYNRYGFDEIKAKQLALAIREKRPVSLIMFDIDRFKLINDSLGHLRGDKVIKDIARMLRIHLRDSDVVARFGGEEFIALLYGADSALGLEVAQRVCNAVKKSYYGDLELTLSAGVSTYLPNEMLEKPILHDSLSHELLTEADKVLYCAKNNGRNMVCSCYNCDKSNLDLTCSRVDTVDG
ncbi:sensor domain-containing diguanylate cyclase [Vibrio kyushuensis]|uniref:GGDEF domain-containing protein n=1 Tax=Vibrio kyushuensis TaxID=2910249 RepID=UPI003D0A84A4